MKPSWNSYLEGLEKVGIRLTKDEKRRQALQFAGIGAASVPLVSSATNLLTYGKVSPWAPMRRWLPAQIVGGALAGGAVPALQHALARSNIERAKARKIGQKALAVAKPKEVALALQPGPVSVPLAKSASAYSAGDLFFEGATLPPDAAAMLAGGRAAISAGRSVAGRSAAKISPSNRKRRARRQARKAAWAAIPLGSLAALAAGRKAGVASKAGKAFTEMFPKGVIASPRSERAIVRFLTNAGTAVLGGLAGGLAAGGAVGAGHQLRGRTEKKKAASQGGQDLRTKGAVPGGITRPPTQDSKAFAAKQLRMSSAEVGPVQPSRAGSKIEDIIPKYRQTSMKVAASAKSAPYQQARKGRRPIRVHNLLKKAGDVMDPTFTDPLVLYLRKQAAQKDGPVEDNVDDLPLGSEESEFSTSPPQPTTRMERGVADTHKETKEHFNTTKGVARKGGEKQFSYDPGVVDRVLSL